MSESNTKNYKRLIPAIAAAFIMWTISTFFNLQGGYDFGAIVSHKVGIMTAAFAFSAMIFILMVERTGRFSVSHAAAHLISLSALIFTFYIGFADTSTTKKGAGNEIDALNQEIAGLEKQQKAVQLKIDQAKADVSNSTIDFDLQKVARLTATIDGKLASKPLGKKTLDEESNGCQKSSWKTACESVKRMQNNRADLLAKIDEEKTRLASQNESDLTLELSDLDDEIAKKKRLRSVQLQKSSGSAQLLNLKPDSISENAFYLLLATVLGFLMEVLTAKAISKAWKIYHDEFGISENSRTNTRPEASTIRPDDGVHAGRGDSKISSIVGEFKDTVADKFAEKLIEKREKEKGKATPNNVFDVKTYLHNMDAKTALKLVDASYLPKGGSKVKKEDVVNGLILALGDYEAKESISINPTWEKLRDENKRKGVDVKFFTKSLFYNWVMPILCEDLKIVKVAQVSANRKSYSWKPEFQTMAALKLTDIKTDSRLGVAV